MVVTLDSLAKHLDTVSDSIVQVVNKASSIVGDGPWSLYLTERASRVPGLSNKLREWNDCNLIHLDFASAAKGCAAYAVDSPHVEFLDQTPVITRIPIDQSVSASNPSKLIEKAMPTDKSADSEG